METNETNQSPIRNLAAYIDHTVLRPETTDEKILQLCAEAREFNFAAVCIPPCFVKLAKEKLEGTQVKVCTVIGFPLGYQLAKVKFFEAHQALADGAQELDVVMNISAFKSGHFEEVENELDELTTLCHFNNAILKVIIETALLTEEEIVKACEICANAGVDYVKTSTGFSSRGASLEDIQLMRESLPASIKIKAAGGIKKRTFAEDLINAGADRLGSSSSVDLISDGKND